MLQYIKEVGLPGDMNNSHMLSIIEQKMCADDRKVWARDLEKEKKPATLEALMNWINVEMKSRMRATAPIRVGTSGKCPVYHFRYDSDKSVWHKCWLCKTSSHWPDQCPKLISLSIDERIATAKANHLCFSCLKRAGRGHTDSLLWLKGYLFWSLGQGSTMSDFICTNVRYGSLHPW